VHGAAGALGWLSTGAQQCTASAGAAAAQIVENAILCSSSRHVGAVGWSRGSAVIESCCRTSVHVATALLLLMQVHQRQAAACSSLLRACLQQLVALDTGPAPLQGSSAAAGVSGLEGAGAAAAAAVQQGEHWTG
jgi:hypothetical protein